MDKFAPFIIILSLLVLWEILSVTGVVPKFMLPSPFDVVKAFIDDFPLLMHHTLDNTGGSIFRTGTGNNTGVSYGYCNGQI